MSLCREVRGRVRRHGGVEGLDAAARHHLASCRRCASEARAAALLRIGSEVPPGAAPRPGFEARLAARLAARGGAAAGLRPERGSAPAGWAETIGALLRPSLSLACALAIAAAGLYLAAGPASEFDLTGLLDQDPILDRVLSGDPAAALTPDAPAAAAAEEWR